MANTLPEIGRDSGAMTARAASSLWLVIGMGSIAYGKERRAVTAFKHMRQARPYFLTTVWEDGSVSDLLRSNDFEFTPVTLGYLGRARLRWTLLNLVLMPRLFLTALRKYREKHCRGIVVLALQPFANLLPVLWLLRKFWRARMFFYLGDIPANTGPNRFLCRVMKSMADAIVVNSEAVRSGLERVGVPARNIEVIDNGVDLERFNKPLPFPWREQFRWNAEAILIGYAGQFTENKGVWDFLEAAQEVLRRDDRCRFLFIGNNDKENECYCRIAGRINEQNLGDKIVFAGWITEMERAYASLDLIVVPSRHEEAGSNVVIEAMASGLPVIATRVGGNSEIVSENETGFLVDKINPSEIATKILQLANDASLRSRLGCGARRAGQLRFDTRQNAAAVERAMIGVL